MATAKTKRPLVARTNDVDRLASKLGSRLKISDVPNNGARTARSSRIPQTTKITRPPEGNRTAAMKSINNVLQSLASSAGSGGGGSSRTGVASFATTGRAALNVLRKLDPKLIDTERAALCMVGKILALKEYDAAIGILEDVRKHLLSLYEHEQDVSSTQIPISLLQLPFPVSSLDASLQTCIQTYFSHSFSVVTHVVSMKSNLIDTFCCALNGPTCLRSWSTLLTELPRKSLDGLFKRVYVALTTSFASPTALPSRILKIRFHALRILLLSSELDVMSFWEQCLKYAASYARSEKTQEEEHERVAVLLECFANVEGAAEGRREGKGWIAFCEYWLELAKRANDKRRLSIVASYIRNAASSSNDISQLITRTCTSLTQLTAALDQNDVDDGEITSKADVASSELHGLRPSLKNIATMDSKLWRTVDRCRRACVRALPRLEPRTAKQSSVVQVIVSIVAFLEQTIDASVGTSPERVDATISVLDSLFQLATGIFRPQNADACDQAYDYLMQSSRLIERLRLDSSEDKRAVANYLRCLSGAFANLAGALYKTERYGFAIRFLTQACPLSTRASIYYSESDPDDAGSTPDKDHDAWLTHKAQVYRRWELLGVCYVRTGDRKLAHEAFVQGIVTYPYEDELSSRAGSFDRTKPPPLLMNAIDRLTHLAVSELRVDATQVSLRRTLDALCLSPSVVGSIVTRQAYSLSDRSKPHIRAAVSALLADILDVYDAVRFPIRRAEALVCVLEHTYYDCDKNAFLDSFNPESVILEAQILLSEKASAGEDSALSHFRPYYQAMILLWSLLHSHRSAKPTEHMQKQAQLVLDAFGDLLAVPAGAPAAKAQNMVRGRKGVSNTITTARSISRSAPKAAASSSRTRNARSNSVRHPRTTPDPSNGKQVNKVYNAPSSGKRELSAEDGTSLAELALMAAQLFDFSGLVLMKLQLLHCVRSLLEKVDATRSEAFFCASSMLAHVLGRLGKLTVAFDVLVPLAKEVRELAPPSSAAVFLLLRYAELLALNGQVSESMAVYDDASRLADNLQDEEGGKGVSAVSRIGSRAATLERAATASCVFAVIQDAKNDPVTSLKAHLQALRLLNRAADTLARLNPARKPDSSQDQDPFTMSDVKDAIVTAESKAANDRKNIPQPRSQLDGLEWRVATALLETQLALAQAHVSRGSVREAEYFEQQAEELALMLGSSAMTTQALLQKLELQMALENLEGAQATAEETMGLARKADNLHEVDARRAIGDRLLLSSEEVRAQNEYDEAAKLLTKIRKAFDPLGNLVAKAPKPGAADAFAPVLQAKILRQQVWLLRDVLGEKYEELLEELFALPQRHYIEVHVNSVLGRLALYDIHERFRADMSLSSLAESTIALPVCMRSEKSMVPAPPQDILDALQQADEHYVSDLSRFSEQDSIINVRAAAVAATLISAYQASLGITYEDSPAFTTHLLDMSCSITLRRELIDAISFKFPNPLDQDDMRWPSESPSKSRRRHTKPKGRGIFDDLSDDYDYSLHDNKLRDYWDYVLKKHQSEAFIQSEISTPEIDSLPDNWIVITISLTEDKNALLLSRQRPKKGPMVFCVPLKDRREEEDDSHFTFDNAMAEFKDIIRLGDEGARGASQIKSDDKEAKIAWWASRKQLDQRMKDLVENIEFCWLGAFKTILSQPMRIPSDAISDLRSRLEKVFNGVLSSHEKKSKKAKLRLETNLLELFAALPPTCRDEELQDVVYFVLDLYHFHGLSVALAEVDIDLVVIDLRSSLEEYHSRNRGKIVPEHDAHTFLVLDKNVQGIPWESLPILRGHSVSRVPSISFLTDRLAWARCQRGLPLDPKEDSEGTSELVDRVFVDPSNGFYMLNPSGDLAGTEGRFKGWVHDLKKVGWEGVVGKTPSEQQFLNALSQRDLVVYFGHGGAEQYARSHKIRHLQRCAATMLWGCSSGALREMGKFDRIGTPNNYMLAGCPSLVANLWDVTDRDIDKFALSVFTKLRLEPGEVGQWKKGKRDFKDGRMSIAAAVAQSRDVCKLKYLTGAAVVVYGLPFYL